MLNNTPPRIKTDEVPVKIRQEIIDMYQQAATISRAMFASRLGMQFNGQRDLYQTFGYVQQPGFNEFRAMYKRQGMANRIVNKFANDMWNKLPVLIDGDSRSDSVDQQATPFIQAWDQLTDRLNLSEVFRQADVMCGFGRYSLIILGAPGKDLSQPAGKDALMFMQAFDESQAIIQKRIISPADPNFMMPESYQVTWFNPEEGLIEIEGTGIVHHSRVIHITHNRLGSRVFGSPDLEIGINRLFDLEKVTGGGAEAAWLTVYKGMLLTAKEGSELPAAGSPEAVYMDEQINNLIHRVQRYAALTDVDVHDLGVDAISISDIFGVLISDLAGTYGIPQRILIGSERGELASSQDMREWNGVISSLRTNQAEPITLKPFVRWCIEHRVLPAPTSGKVKYEWQDVYPETLKEKADRALTLAQGANSITGGTPEEAFDPNEWRAVVGMSPRTPAQLQEIEEEKIDEQEREIEKLQATKAPAIGGKPPSLVKARQNGFVNSIQSLGHFLFPNAFPDHRGRPGLRGGSLPRSAGTGTGGRDRNRNKNAVEKIAADFGFDKKKIVYAVGNHEMMVGGQRYEKAAEYSPETGEIFIYNVEAAIPSEAEGIAAHEMMHVKWDEMITSNEPWAMEIKNKYLNDPETAQQLGFLDGVSPYSQSHWMQAGKSKSKKRWEAVDLALTETLSEVGRIQYEDSDAFGEVDPLWQDFYYAVKAGG